MQPRTTVCGMSRLQYTIPNYNIRIYTYNRPIATLPPPPAPQHKRA